MKMNNLSVTRIAAMTIAALLIAACSPEKELRIMSYNVNDCIGTDSIRDVQRVADIILAAAPDLVAVQEVGLADESTLEELAAATSMMATSGDNKGLGILSKEQPRSTRFVPLRGADAEVGILLVEFRKYYFATVAFSSSLPEQISSVATLKEVAGTLDRPLFFGGSLSARYGSQTVSNIARDFTPLVNLSARTFPADAPTALVDYIFMYNRNLRDFSVGNLTALNEPVASPHRPIVAEISFR